MIALDTNILVYAHRADSPHHALAARAVQELAEGVGAVAVPWPCVHEFLAITTHPKIYDPPSTVSQAWAAVSALADLAHVQLLAEGADHRARLEALMGAAPVAGPRVHDARIAAICLSHGARELWTADRDFSLFPALRTRNPLAQPSSS